MPWNAIESKRSTAAGALGDSIALIRSLNAPLEEPVLSSSIIPLLLLSLQRRLPRLPARRPVGALPPPTFAAAPPRPGLSLRAPGASRQPAMEAAPTLARFHSHGT